MTESIPDPADAVVRQVAQSIGGLSLEEQLAVYGGASSYYAIAPVGAPPALAVPLLRDVLVALRRGPCRWCGRGLTGHGMDVTEYGVEVRCQHDVGSMAAGRWLAGPPPAPIGRSLVAFLMWVVVPLLSLGLLSWLMPLIAAIARRRRSWAIGAVVFGLLLTAALVGPEDLAAIPLLIAWLGAPVWGAFQIKPWLRSFAGR